MRTVTSFAKLGLAGIVGLLGIAAPAAASAHDRGHAQGGRGGDHGHAVYQGQHGYGGGGWNNGGGWRGGGGHPAVQVRVGGPSFHPGFHGGAVIRPHQIWVPGYWGYRANRRIWIEGAWGMPPQANMVWMAPQWIWNDQAQQWVWSEGHWAPGAYQGY
jgi:hypothetical protein